MMPNTWTEDDFMEELYEAAKDMVRVSRINPSDQSRRLEAAVQGLEAIWELQAAETRNRWKKEIDAFNERARLAREEMEKQLELEAAAVMEWKERYGKDR